MSNFRIVFMGTPEFAVASLESLIENKYNIVGVITAPDKQAGRGRKLKQSEVKKFALKNNLNILQPTNLQNSEFIEELKSLNADLQIVVAFRMLPKVVWDSAKLGTFNLHASLLPEYRGAAPINWAIINGETKTGVTTFFINEKIDTGSILLQESMTISSTDSMGDLHDSLKKLGSELIINTIKLLETGNYTVKIQPLEEKKPAPKLNKNNCQIDWSDSLENIYNKIRGLSPYPGAWTFLQNNEEKLEVKIYKSQQIAEPHAYETGKLLFTKKELKVAVKNGYISIIEIKMAGKRQMDTKSLLNGFTFSEDAKVL